MCINELTLKLWKYTKLPINKKYMTMFLAPGIQKGMDNLLHQNTNSYCSSPTVSKY